MLYQMLSVLIVISLTNLYILAALPFMLGIMFCLFRYFIHGYREVTRIETVSKSPLLNQFNETVSGCSTIRAFGNQHEFVLKNNVFLNNNILAN